MADAWKRLVDGARRVAARDTNVTSNSSRDGSTQSDDEHPDIDTFADCRWCVATVGPSVDAARGGAFAVEEPLLWWRTQAAAPASGRRPPHGRHRRRPSPYGARREPRLPGAATTEPPPGCRRPGARPSWAGLRVRRRLGWLASLTGQAHTSAAPAAATAGRWSGAQDARAPPRRRARRARCADTPVLGRARAVGARAMSAGPYACCASPPSPK